MPQPHGFFTRQFYPTPPADLTKALSALATSYRLKQVHSADVLTPTEVAKAIASGLPNLADGTQAAFPLADGLITEKSDQAVWACSADCTPALISDVVTGQVSAVHAGWRGTAQKILPVAVARLQAQGSQLKNLRVALGPAIAGEVYQVKHEVAAEVGASVVASGTAETSPVAIVEQLLAMKNPPLLSDPAENRVRLDVRRINQIQLEQLGLDSEQVAIAPHCTYQEPRQLFFLPPHGRKTGAVGRYCQYLRPRHSRHSRHCHRLAADCQTRASKTPQSRQSKSPKRCEITGSASGVRVTTGPRPKAKNKMPQSGENNSAHCQAIPPPSLRGCAANPQITPPKIDVINVKIHCSRGSPGTTAQPPLVQAGFQRINCPQHSAIFAIISHVKLVAKARLQLNPKGSRQQWIKVVTHAEVE